MIQSELRKQFPVTDVTLEGEGRSVKLRTIPIKKIPEVITFVARIAQDLDRSKVSGDENSTDTDKDLTAYVVELLPLISDEVFSILEICLVDASIDDLTSGDVPIILAAIINQNFSVETIKNWTSLFRSVAGSLPAVKQA